MSNPDTVTPAKHKPLFRGVCASSITPFNADGTFALARLKPHIDWLIAEGVSAISRLVVQESSPAWNQTTASA